MIKKILIGLLLAGGLLAFTVNSYAAAETPASVYQEVLGSVRLIIANFSGGTADDGDTWTSGLAESPISFWAQDTDNPSTQASVGVAVAYSAGTFTFYPAEDNKSFYLFVLVRS